MGATFSKPDKSVHWADGEGSVVAEPSEAKKSEGWDFEEVPPRTWENWMKRYYGFWFGFLNERMSDGPTEGGGEAQNQFVITEPRNKYPVMRFSCGGGTTTVFALPPGDGVKLSSLGATGAYYWDHAYIKTAHVQKLLNENMAFAFLQLGSDVTVDGDGHKITPDTAVDVTNSTSITVASGEMKASVSGKYLVTCSFQVSTTLAALVHLKATRLYDEASSILLAEKFINLPASSEHVVAFSFILDMAPVGGFDTKLVFEADKEDNNYVVESHGGDGTSNMTVTLIQQNT
jgi:carbon monoxide dehydrogenase subunit G